MNEWLNGMAERMDVPVVHVEEERAFVGAQLIAEQSLEVRHEDLAILRRH